MLLASALLSAFCSFVTAQITVTNATFPAAGDSLVFAVDNSPVGMNPATPPGGGQTWNFSALQKDETLSIVYRPASSGTQVASFPGSDLAILGQAGETYFNVTSSKFEAMGYSGGDPTGFGLNVVAKFNPVIVERSSPMNFFDINSQSTNLSLPFSTDGLPDTLFSGLPLVPDSIRVRISTQRLDVVDGYGTCQIPGGTYPVLRQKRTDYTTTGLDVKLPFVGWLDISTFLGGGGGGVGGFLGTDTTVTFRFLSNTEKEEIAIATMSTDLSVIESIRFKNISTSAAPVLVDEFSSGIQAFPNPAVEWVRFDCTNLNPGEYTLKIFNILGKCVWKKNYTLSGTTSFRVELDDFKKGTYIYSLVDKQGNAVGTKRLVVLKP